MGSLATWQQIVVAGVAIVSVGFMGAQILRLQRRRSEARATQRPGTDAESGLYGAKAPDGAEVFDGFSYRVGARFAGRARVVVKGERVSFCAPRGPSALYWFWIWAMGISMTLMVPAAAWAIVALDWKMALWTLGLGVISTLVMAIGAGVWPGLGEVPGLTDGHFPTLEHAVANARDVKLGPGWADGGLSWVLLPYVGPINQLAAGHAVSWFGPDERGREVRYAIHCYDTAQAKRLYELLAAQD